MKVYRLKDEWKSAQGLEDALSMRLNELMALAMRQGHQSPRWSQVPGNLADMFEMLEVEIVTVPEAPPRKPAPPRTPKSRG